LTPSSPRSRFSSSFGITVDRKRELKWLFSQEKATLHTANEDHTNSETALKLSTEQGTVILSEVKDLRLLLNEKNFTDTPLGPP
jgi:hypothetical protein